MNDIQVVRYQKRLENLFKQIALLTDNLELQSHWARYLCVLVSGFLEISIRSVYTAYAKDSSSPNVGNFVESHLERLQNPNMEKIAGLVGSFSSQWESDLRIATEGELKDAVDSIVANRNKIAHGEDVGITYARVQDYYKRIVRVLELVERQCAR
jgi:hypothetical protein